MPSLVPSPSAMRGLSIRAFSTTAAARAPPRGDSHQRHSSTSSLLSINNPTSSSSRSSAPPTLRPVGAQAQRSCVGLDDEI
ncbi:uncharacterized protein TrAtP1_006875 [Trichoderma atroviride]|uniref:uncharacterized protein n=1 Tax=Hypocrea atroviridis TaxID=63577 RepID=UPI00331E9FB4|nr:hypothetical protein TrAtP1_006875 [Trichoderma atroviride]